MAYVGGLGTLFCIAPISSVATMQRLDHRIIHLESNVAPTLICRSCNVHVRDRDSAELSETEYESE